MALYGLFYIPIYPYLQTKNSHFLKCYVSHMYMFRDLDLDGSVNCCERFVAILAYPFSMLYLPKYHLRCFSLETSLSYNCLFNFFGLNPLDNGFLSSMLYFPTISQNVHNIFSIHPNIFPIYKRMSWPLI